MACHPFLLDNPIEAWGDADSRDEVHYLSGLVYRRKFRHWREGEGFDLEICHRHKPIAWVSWRITPAGDDAALLHITVYPCGLQEQPLLTRWLPHLAVVRPRLRSYLSSVVRGFKWYVEKGEAVPRMQFGRHPWFC